MRAPWRVVDRKEIVRVAFEARVKIHPTGSELGRRGVNVSKGSTNEKLGPWSATANVDAPSIVRQVHEDYLRLGVDIITSNSFWTNRPKLAVIGLSDRWEEYTRAAGELAIQARDAVNAAAYVAGGIARHAH